ncbi:metaxin 1 [Schizosaccharomyces cryophilus OY26]|uniref:Metaxin 1 n=1 Tax=Schizosaccharomyces cryophilus (strain OY26 / ATCC MYA-4695 / CBS 11777 / NBRC 106824 / NRRL Y48691) TaxID=653667 RepID=S9W6B4_SCHCR|nr:metaxin 1 [Schizosaccharomyces cryophilus OY26]EPY53355.1 metaxin 1 [Schizosaccharomyces cryophilus OY26]
MSSLAKISSFYRSIFKNFPLFTFDNPYPAVNEKLNTKPVLYVSDWNGEPISESLDLESLQWQTWVKIHDPEIILLNVSNHASPDQNTPFLQVVSHKVVLKNALLLYLVNDEQLLQAITPWMSLLTGPVQIALNYSMYLDETNFQELRKNWFAKATWPLSLIRSIAQPLEKKKQLRILTEEKHLDADTIFEDAARAFSSLSEFLGNQIYFLNKETPSILDISVFSYAEIILHLPLRNDQLRLSLTSNKNLLELTNRVRALAGYNSYGSTLIDDE